MGCCTCALACRQWHSTEREVLPWRWIETMEEGVFPEVRVSFLSLSCLHCASPSCLVVCPEEAIFKRESDGLVLVDQNKCVGEAECGLCEDACPYGVPRFNPAQGGKMEKCDLCALRLSLGQAPICVASCPNRALQIGSLETLAGLPGSSREATGFVFSTKVGPSIVFKKGSRG